MKRIFFVAVALVLLLSLSSVSFAKVQHENLLMKKIVIVEDVPAISSVTVDNGRGAVFSNGKVVLSIPEIGVRDSAKISLNAGRRDTTHVVLGLRDALPAGDYWVRVVVTNEDVTRIRHRLITIG